MIVTIPHYNQWSNISKFSIFNQFIYIVFLYNLNNHFFKS
jgi:hypothetical protein